MTNLDAIIKATQLSDNLKKSFGLNSPLSEMLKTQEKITNSISGLTMVNEIAKSLKIVQPTFPAMDTITKSMNWQKNLIPQTTLDTISSINRQHEQLFGNLRNITEVLNKHQYVFSQINNWQFAISGLSGQLAAIAASQQKWDLIDDFEEITEEAISLNEKIYDENGISKEGLAELKEFFQRIEIKVDKIDADANSIFWKFITLIGIILAFTDEIRNWLPKPNYATKQEVEEVIKDQFKLYESKLKEEKELRITDRECKVLIKPQMKSVVIEKLPCDYEVVVLQTNHKWTYVSYISPKDNLPQTGWVMKKYLNKLK